jgi:hypothetical protein
VELVRLYSNLSREAELLRRVGSAASSPRPADGSRQARQHQRRLSMTEVTKLIKAYDEQETIKELAKRCGIHRLTVTALLRRRGAQLRRSGLAPADLPAAAHMYGQGWSPCST